MLIECWGQLRIQHLPGTSRKLFKNKHYIPRHCEGMFGSEPDNGSNRHDKHQQLLSHPLSYFFVKVVKVMQLEGLKNRERERERESRSSDRPHILLSSIPAGS